LSGKTVSGVTLVLLVTSMLVLTATIRPVKAGGTIYIRAGGSVDPPTAPVSTLDKVIYTLTDNIISSSTGITVERDNVTIDGNQYTVQGPDYEILYGIDLTGRSNVTIKNMNIKGFSYGIWLNSSSNNNVSGNNITANNYDGIDLHSSSYNSVSGNNIANNNDGIYLDSSSNNNVSGNTITANNHDGIDLSISSYNSLGRNNITNNYDGIDFSWSCSDNSVGGNNITDNYDGIYVIGSSDNNVGGNNIANNNNGIFDDGNSYDNRVSGNNIAYNNNGITFSYSPLSSGSKASRNNVIYHNNFVNNTIQAFSKLPAANVWDDGYPSGGNYWSDYTGIDLYWGLYQNETGRDGIGDTQYVIDENNTDHYPIMNPYTPQPDVAVMNVSPFKTVVGLGYSLDIYATVENQGIYTETFNVTAYDGNGTFTTEQWNVYWSKGDCNRDGYIDLTDINIISTNFGRSAPIWPDPNWSNPADINSDGKVNMADVGICAKSTGLNYSIWKCFLPAIGTQTIENLNEGDSAALMLPWNTTSLACGNYAITAVAKPVTNETNTADNNYTSWVTVTIPGDIDGDFIVKLADLALLAQAYGSEPADLNWNPNADIDGNGIVGLSDLVALAQHYGQHYP
jgi:parallel beta-helix repeat protein